MAVLACMHSSRFRPRMNAITERLTARTCACTARTRACQVLLALKDCALTHSRMHVQAFLKCCILAYECGYREDDVVLKLTEACDTSTSMLPATYVVACAEGVCIIWLALEQTAKSITRWSDRAPRFCRRT